MPCLEGSSYTTGSAPTNLWIISGLDPLAGKTGGREAGSGVPYDRLRRLHFSMV
jgi:hypothetical protein